MTKRFSKAINKLQSLLVNSEIQDINIHICYLDKSLKMLFNSFKKVFPSIILNDFYKFCIPIFDKIRDRSVQVHNRKILNLKKSQLHNGYIYNSGSPNSNSNLWFKNYTDIDIPKSIINVVSLRQKHNIQTKSDERSVIDVVKNLESFFMKYNNNEITTFTDIQVL